ncbi:MAG: hypothetical protein Q7T72_08270 [Bacteroidales bacterium]|nr:hypothetical protein [Bacteroidales bacterium]
MKERITHITVKRKLFIALLFSFIAFFCFSFKTNAQGWTFTFQMYANGNCGGVQLPTITVPNLGIPTKSQCESLRQQVLAIKVTGGNCSMGYTCTPCTGSDIASNGSDIANGQVKPGEVSFDPGKPFFTTHQSSAFEDWARDYRQQLESYGITSILGKNITPNQIPLTGNMNFDKFYYSQSATFNPTTPINNLSNQDASVVDFSGKSDISGKTLPVMGGSPMTIEEMQRQKLINQFGPNYIDQANMFKQALDGDIDKNGEDHPVIDLTREIGVTIVGWAPGAAGYIGIVGVNFIAEDAKAIKDIYDGKDCPSTETIFKNALKNIAVDEGKQLLGNAKEELVGKTFEFAGAPISKEFGKGIAEMSKTFFSTSEKMKDVGGKGGILDKISAAAWLLGTNNY